MCYEWLFSQQILEALITMLYTTLYAIVVGICIYYCRYVYTQYPYYNIYIYISKQLMTTYLHYSLDWFEAPKSGSYGPYFPLTASIHGSVFLSSCVYTHIIYIYTSLSPLIFHLDIPFGNWPIAPKYISHNPITHSYWTLPFYGTRYVVSSPTSTMLSRVCSI